MNKFEMLIEEVSKKDNIVVSILSHENPDGDAIGSSCAMYNYIQNIYRMHLTNGQYSQELYDKKVANLFMVQDVLPKNLDFLRGYSDTKTYDEFMQKGLPCDVAILLDASQANRFGQRISILESSKISFCFDHHEDPQEDLCTYMSVDPNIIATCQFLYMVMPKDTQWSYVEYGNCMSPDVLKCLLTGVITDSGGFRFQGTNDISFAMYKKALTMNINVARIFEELFGRKDKVQIALEAAALGRIKYYADGKIAVSYISGEDQGYDEKQSGQTSAIVNMLLGIDGVQVSVFAREYNGGTKISLRKKTTCDIELDKVASVFGGGGHIYAAGATVDEKIEDVLPMVVEKIGEMQNWKL